MQPFVVKKNSKINLVRASLFLTFVSLSILTVFSVTDLKNKKSVNPSVTEGLLVNPTGNSSLKNTNPWERYVNNEFGYSFLYPGFLVKREMKEPEGYLHFIRFEESSLSSGSGQKGVAVGVSDVGVEAEAVKIKKALLNDGGELASEKKVNFGGQNVLKLDFTPKDPNTSEKRTVIIVSINGKTYSISSVPEQMDKILDNFVFLKN